MTLTGVRHSAAALLLSAMLLAGVCASWIAPRGYADQDRDRPDARPSKHSWLGTDELGRDRFSRLVYGTRVSLLLAPAAAILSVGIAVVMAGLTGFAIPGLDQISRGATDVLLSLPTILILLTARAVLPLNVSAWSSILITGLLLGTLNWPASARVIRAEMAALSQADFILQARAMGQSTVRILIRQLMPNLGRVLVAQFSILVPVFILTEANLSLLGLGVSEPMPSWGNLLRELENYSAIPERPWVLVPLAVQMLAILSLYAVLPSGEER